MTDHHRIRDQARSTVLVRASWSGPAGELVPRSLTTGQKVGRERGEKRIAQDGAAQSRLRVYLRQNFGVTRAHAQT